MFAGYQRRYGLNRLEARLRRWLPPWVGPRVLGPRRGVAEGGRAATAAPGQVRPAEPRNDVRAGILPGPVGLPQGREGRLLSPGSRRSWECTTRSRQSSGTSRASGIASRSSSFYYVDLKSWLANDILVKVDRMSMANSLEVRAPLLDHRVIEFAAGVSTHLKYRGRVSKYLLKRYVEARLPGLNVHRRKQGFVIPLAAWLRGTCGRSPRISCSLRARARLLRARASPSALARASAAGARPRRPAVGPHGVRAVAAHVRRPEPAAAPSTRPDEDQAHEDVRREGQDGWIGGRGDRSSVRR